MTGTYRYIIEKPDSAPVLAYIVSVSQFMTVRYRRVLIEKKSIRWSNRRRAAFGSVVAKMPTTEQIAHICHIAGLPQN